jgi:hypothetical protein
LKSNKGDLVGTNTLYGFAENRKSVATGIVDTNQFSDRSIANIASQYTFVFGASFAHWSLVVGRDDRPAACQIGRSCRRTPLHSPDQDRRCRFQPERHIQRAVKRADVSPTAAALMLLSGIAFAIVAKHFAVKEQLRDAEASLFGPHWNDLKYAKGFMWDTLFSASQNPSEKRLGFFISMRIKFGRPGVRR